MSSIRRTKSIISLAVLFFLALTITGCAPATSPAPPPPAPAAAEPTQALAPTVLAEGLSASPAETGTPLPQITPAVPTNAVQEMKYLPTRTISPPANTAPADEPPLFSSSTLNPHPPDNILEEFSYAMGSGPGDEMGAFPNDAECQAASGQPTLVSSLEGIIAADSVPQFTAKTIHACGWRAGETVHIILSYPDGRTAQSEMAADAQGHVEYTYQPEIGDLSGSYRVALEGNGGRVEAGFEVTSPARPGILHRQDRLLIYGFAPGETVRLLAYQRLNADTDGRLVGWQDFAANADGRLPLKLDLPGTGLLFFALGSQNQAGKVDYITQDGPACNPGYASAIHRDMQVRLANGVEAQSAAAITDVISGSATPLSLQGEIVTVQAGPACVTDFNTGNNQLWWQIQFSDGRTIWIPEMVTNNRILIP